MSIKYTGMLNVVILPVVPITTDNLLTVSLPVAVIIERNAGYSYPSSCPDIL
jgi:hypothetical protein